VSIYIIENQGGRVLRINLISGILPRKEQERLRRQKQRRKIWDKSLAFLSRVFVPKSNFHLWSLVGSAVLLAVLIFATIAGVSSVYANSQARKAEALEQERIFQEGQAERRERAREKKALALEEARREAQRIADQTHHTSSGTLCFHDAELRKCFVRLPAQLDPEQGWVETDCNHRLP